MTSAYALQEAIYAHLTTDTSLMSQVTGVFDHVSQGTEYPYLYFGESNIAREQLSLMEVETVTLRLSLASREYGRGESNSIIQRVFELLHNNANVNVTGYNLARLQLSQPDTERGKDGLSYETNVTLSAVLTAI